MSAIGGIVSWNQPTVDSKPLFDMSRAMLLRGGAQRRAVVQKNLALLQHGAPPQSLFRDERRYTLLLDGSPSLCPSEDEEDERFLFPESEEPSLLETFLTLREGLADALQGRFALAIADEARAELYLARDAEGSCPLFYREEEGVFFFASEIKAILRTLSSPIRIDTERLRAHLTSPYGAEPIDALYCDVSALPAGHSATLSRLGLRIFPNHAKPSLPWYGVPDIACPELYAPTEEELSMMLTELLYAFDAPQFDFLMPTLLHELKLLSARGTTRAQKLEDPALYMNLAYAKERADRIGSIYGLTLAPAAPARFFAKERDLKKLDRRLRSLLGSIDTAPLRFLLGEQWHRELSKEKNTAKRIRRAAMAYQTVLWLTHVPLVFP